MTSGEQVVKKALEILEMSPNGIRWNVMVKMVKEAFPDFPWGTITGNLWDMDKYNSDQVFKPARGLWKLVKYKDQNEVIQPFVKQEISAKKSIKEEDFYQSFADWLINDQDECTKTISLGGNKFGGKWGTPDVIGIRKSLESDIVKIPTEVVSAEIKLNEGSLIEAFGQACSYKLFSNKCYLVVPESSNEEDIYRLDALCMIFGIGLVLFNSSNTAD